MRKRLSVLLVVLVIALAACAAPAAAPVPPPTAAPANSRAIVLGDIDSQPTDQIQRWQLLADYLAANLEEFGIRDGYVRVAPDMATMGSWLESGEVDLTFESIYPAMVQITTFGSTPLLRQWKGGDATYSSVIFTRADSGVSTLDELRGQRIAFEQPSSTTAFFLPTFALFDAGLLPIALQAPEAFVAPDRVGYVFSDADSNTIQWVISGKVTAGATSNQDYRDIPEETRQQLKVLYETPMVPRQLVLARTGLEPELRERIASLLIALSSHPDGEAILQAFEGTARFDALPPEVLDELKRFEEMQKQLEQ